MQQRNAGSPWFAGSEDQSAPPADRVFQGRAMLGWCLLSWMVPLGSPFLSSKDFCREQGEIWIKTKKLISPQKGILASSHPFLQDLNSCFSWEINSSWRMLPIAWSHILQHPHLWEEGLDHIQAFRKVWHPHSHKGWGALLTFNEHWLGMPHTLQCAWHPNILPDLHL